MVATAEVPKGVAAERLRRHYRRRHVMARVGLYVAAVLAAFICAAPFLWSLVTAFKQNRDLYNPENNPFFFNLAATPDHVLYLLRDTAFDVLVTGESRFDELPGVMERLAAGSLPALCHTITYDAE